MVERLQKFGLIFFILVATLFSASCGSKPTPQKTSSGKSVKLVFWNTMSPSESQYLVPLLDKFSSNNPGITVEMESLPFLQTQAKFEQAMKTGIIPDVLRADRFWIPQFAKAGLLEELHPNALKSELEDLIPFVKQVVMTDEKLWGLPHSIDCLGLFFNKGRFEEKGISPPGDFDAFRVAAQKTTEAGKGKFGFFMNPEGWFFDPFFRGFGGRYFDSSGNLAVKSDQMLKATHYLMELKDTLKVMPPVNLRSNSYDLMMQSFKNGQVAMMINGPWCIRDALEGNAFKDKSDNLGVAPVPKGPVGRETPVGCQSYVIPKGTKNFKEALMLLKFLCSEEVESVLSKGNFGIPARKSLFTDPELRKDPFLGPFLKQLQEIQTLDSSPHLSKLMLPMGQYLKKVLNGDVTPEDGIKDFESNWESRP